MVNHFLGCFFGQGTVLVLAACSINQALFDFGNYTALLARHNAALKEPYLLELTPKEGEKYTLYLTLSKEDYFPINIKIVADLMTTEAKLTDTQKNTPLSFNTFRAGGLFK